MGFMGLKSTLITADSKPDYDEWGPDYYWGTEEWITWHKALKDRHGLAVANQLWLEGWKAQSIWDKPFNWAKYDSDFANYFKSQGIDVGHLLSKVVVAGETTVENVAQAAVFTSNFLPTIITAGVILAGFIIYKEATQ